MTPIIITMSRLIPSKQGRINSGTDLGTGYGLWFSYPTGFYESLKIIFGSKINAVKAQK